MKYSKHFAAAALIAVISTAFSCRQATESTEEVAPSVVVQAQIAGSSKAIARTTSFAQNDDMGLYIVPCSSSGTTPVSNTFLPIGNYRDNVKYTHNGTTGFVVNDAKNANYPNSLTIVDLYAISPWQNLVSTSGSLTNVKKYPFQVKTDQSTVANVIASDIMTAQVLRKDPDTNPATFTFDHRLSKTHIAVNKPTTYKGDAVSAVKSVKIDGTYTSAQIDLTDNTNNVSADKTNGTIQQIKACYDATSTDPTYSFEAIIIPQEVQNLQVTITITAAGVDHDFKYSAPAPFTFLAGYNHNMTFNLESEHVLLVGNPIITNWGTNTIATGVIVPEQAATEAFRLAGIGAVAGLVSAKVTCADTKTFTIPATQNGADVTFKFNGLFNSAPERYPYTITKVELLDNNGGVIIGTEYDVDQQKGLVQQRTTSEIQLN